MAIEDIADTPGISLDSFSGPADRQRPAGLVDARGHASLQSSWAGDWGGRNQTASSSSAAVG
jgi:hypothetical protein